MDRVFSGAMSLSFTNEKFSLTEVYRYVLQGVHCIIEDCTYIKGYPAQQAQGQSYPQQHQVYPQQTAYPSSGGPPRPSGTGPNAYSARQPLAYPQQQVTHRPAATSAGKSPLLL